MPVSYSEDSSGPGTRQADESVPGYFAPLPEVVNPEFITETSYAEEVNATAGAKSLAVELSLDLRNVVGTGLNGKITKADVEAAAA